MPYAQPTFTLFLLKEEDAPALAALEAACFALPWSEEQYKKILRQNALSMFAMDRQTICAGSAGSEPPRNAPAANRTSAASDCSPQPPLPATPVFGVRAQNGELAAYVCLGVYPSIQELEIYNIAVRSSYRQQGLGKRLLFHALKMAWQYGIERALLEVRPSNAAALALYAASGFAICGSRKNYYKDSREDALILACELNTLFA